MIVLSQFIDLTNKKFGKWTVLSQGKQKNNQIYWKCRCDCGTEREVNGQSLRSQTSTNCGCVRKQHLSNQGENLLLQKFNSLLVIGEKEDNKWKCQCDCGNITYVTTSNLKSGHIKHCKQCGYKIGAEKRTIDLTGQKFGLLTVLSQSDTKPVKWLCQCQCGNIKEIGGSSLKQHLTESCGCLKSKGEQKIISLLSNNNIPFEYQKTFPDCIFPNSNKKAIFDFYVDNRYIIEYDGEQHFQYSNNGWNTKEAFEALQKRDSIKNEWCKKQGITFIRIPYTHLEIISIEDLLENRQFKRA